MVSSFIIERVLPLLLGQFIITRTCVRSGLTYTRKGIRDLSGSVSRQDLVAETLARTH